MALVAVGTAGSPMILTSGLSTSTPIKFLDDAYALTIYSPSTFTSTTINVSICPTDTGSNFTVLQSGGVDITLTGGRALVLSPAPFKQLRIETNAAEALTLSFVVTKTVLL